MRNKLLTAALVTVSLSASAKEPTQIEYCTGLSKFAGVTMELRQLGAPLSSVLKASESDLTRKIILIAYKQKRQHKKAAQQIAISDFENDAMLSCMGKEFAKESNHE